MLYLNILSVHINSKHIRFLVLTLITAIITIVHAIYCHQSAHLSGNDRILLRRLHFSLETSSLRGWEERSWSGGLVSVQSCILLRMAARQKHPQNADGNKLWISLFREAATMLNFIKLGLQLHCILTFPFSLSKSSL